MQWLLLKSFFKNLFSIYKLMVWFQKYFVSKYMIVVAILRIHLFSYLFIVKHKKKEKKIVFPIVFSVFEAHT